MKTNALRALLSTAILVLGQLSFGQIFQQIGTTGVYETSLVGGVNGVVVGAPGAQPNPFAALTVDGNSLNATTGDAFKTTGPATSLLTWKMFRGTGTGTEIGRLYGLAGSSGSVPNSFNVKAMVQGSTSTNTSVSLWLRNARDNGIRLIDDIDFDIVSSGSVTYSTNHRGGYAAIGDQSVMGAASGSYAALPWARLHLVQGDAQAAYGYRPWMRNGTLITGNTGQMYVGHMYATDGVNHGVMQISNTGTLGTNRQTIRFIHTTGATSGGAASESLNGMEFMRMYPQSYSEGYVGVGDFNASGTNPTERLDVLNRTIRIQRLIADYHDDALTNVVVADANGRLYWRAASTLTDCDWSIASGTAAGTNHISTAYAASDVDNCPDETEAVGIGINLAGQTVTAKLNVETNDFAGGIVVNNTATSFATTTGLRSDASGGTAGTYAAFLKATQTANADNYGGYIDAVGTGGTGFNLGLDVNAVNSSGSAVGANYGVRTTVTDNNTGAENYGFHTLVTGTGSGSVNNAVDARVNSGTSGGPGTGVRSEVYGGGTGTTNMGLFAKAYVNQSGATSYGVFSQAVGTGSTEFNYGVYGFADEGEKNYGVYGYAEAPNTDKYAYGVYGGALTDGDRSWAVYAEGDTYNASPTWGTSDAGLKENIEDMSEALARILQLQPRTFNYRTDEFSFLNLPQGNQFGLIAQEVEPIFPDLVRTISRPNQVDSTGVEIAPTMEFKALQYGSFIPILIAAVKEQNATIVGLQQQIMDTQPLAQQMATMQEQLAAMQEQLSACCASGGMAPQGGGTGTVVRSSIEAETIMGNARNLLITPNPFVHQATLTFTLDHASRVQLLANSADGKQLRVLSEASMEAGQYSYSWDTTDLAPGMYYVTLLLDGEPLVKKAVRVKE